VIRRLALKNWRNYEDIDLELNPGTTFIVAPNGVGKTSLMEAASWAIFGPLGQHPGDAVRKGASSAIATAEIQLPDQRILSITRTLPKKPSATILQPSAHLDGKQISPAAATEEIRSAYAADPTFLLRLTMPSGHIDARRPSEFGLEDHLCHFFGIEALRQAVENLDQRLKAQQKRIKATKQGSLPTPTVLSALRDRVAANEEAAAAAAAAHAHMSAVLDSARRAEHNRGLLIEWQKRVASYTHALSELAAAAAADVSLGPQNPDAVQSALDTALDSVQRQLEAVRVQRAQLAGHSAAIEQHSKDLDSAHGDCPVCHRPLDAETVRFASSAHQTELKQIHAEVEHLSQQEAELVGKQQRLHALIQSFRSLPRPGPSPAAATSADMTVGKSVDELDAELRDALDRLVRHRTELATSQAELDAILASQAAHTELQRLYAQEAVLRASREAISTAKNKLLYETIQPLAHELDARWGPLFPGRGRLRTQPTGAVSRELAGETLPDTEFSTGERTGLVILLRLLVLETVTKANFCWLDEPLEHLDPDSRRRVAGILARASTAGPLKQIVVTTYEEPLARRVHERDPHNVSLVYVRPSPD
jgi:DNA repair exonuclease SbcCD ATPase subunit